MISSCYYLYVIAVDFFLSYFFFSLLIYIFVRSSRTIADALRTGYTLSITLSIGFYIGYELYLPGTNYIYMVLYDGLLTVRPRPLPIIL